MNSLLLKNVRPFDRNEPVDCLIQFGKIAKLETSVTEQADEVIDAAGSMLIPAAIDAHVHFRVPGGEAKEDWNTGSAAALAGGVTTVLDMPNTNPAITTFDLLKKKIETVRKSAAVDFGCYIAATDDNIEEIERSAQTACGVKVYYGSTTGDLLMNDQTALRTLFERELSLPIVIHAEDDAVISSHAHEFGQYTEMDIHGKVRPREAAIKALEAILPLAEETGAPVHITHVTTREEIELIRQAKKRGSHVTCDVTPHHLAFTEADIKENFLLRVNPPLRSQADVDALWEGIRDRTVDLVVSDHAPHLLNEKKSSNYWDVPSGVPGVETLLPFLLDNLSDELSIEDVVRLTSTMPARLFHMSGKGVIQDGAVADLVLLDLTGSTTIQNSKVRSKCGWTPFHGRIFRGAIDTVIRHGSVVFRR